MGEAGDMIIMYLPFALLIAGVLIGITSFIKQYRTNELQLSKYNKAQFLDFGVLALRWYLAYYMIDYGWGKMTVGQFGLNDPDMLNKPLKEIDKFHLAWHLFSLNNVIDFAVGPVQILGGILIVINRTTLIGALLLLPVLGQIFLIDVAYTTNIFGAALPVRLAGMIMSDILILFYYKEKVISAFRYLTTNVTTRVSYKWWIFLLLPAIGLFMDFVWAILLMPIQQLLNWLLKTL
jgi:uncharacterized membrane protein YphA (DoxX/SURF4 family)